jgi:4-amino-4-deoxy-L-arabinose transferase-like glycosyltransferase
MMLRRGWQPIYWSGLWLILIIVTLLTRPLLPVDETRYLAVAWEMWTGGDWLVPHLNGATYSHKPPLLFWIVNAGWTVFGVNDWWSRLVAPLFGLASLFLTCILARRLWPEEGPKIALTAPLILFGGIFWTVFTTATMFDLILTFCALVGLVGIVKAWRGDWTGFAILGLGIGLGVLTKGPAILLHTLPVALLAPYWGKAMPGERKGWLHWYLGVLAAVVLGVLIALAWAIPAALSGGEAYANAIFWGQSAGRMVNSFAHGRPWWWYGVVLPGLVFPWTVWPPLWRAMGGVKTWKAGGGLRAFLTDEGGRFCVAWFAPAFIVFSAISGKQLHYLLPILPALALFAGFLLSGAPKVVATERRIDQVIPGLLIALIGAAAAVLPLVWVPPVAQSANFGWGLFLIAAGLAVAAFPKGGTQARVAALAGLSTAAVVGVHFAAQPVLAERFDLSEVASRLGQWEREGRPLAHHDKYHGQFQFLGRLQKPLQILSEHRVRDWALKNPTGKIVSYRGTPPTDVKPEVLYPFRGRYIVVWDAATAAEHPGAVKRETEPPKPSQ